MYIRPEIREYESKRGAAATKGYNEDMMDERIFELFLELHKGLPRQAPGSAQSTRRALAGLPLTGDVSQELLIADMGCGPGSHALELLEALAGNVFALDLLPMFLKEAQDLVHAAGHGRRLCTLQADMARPPFAQGSLDLIWSEGAVYNIGFAKGLKLWAPLLQNGGFLAVSELCWLEAHPPSEAGSFWAEEYPAMQGVQERIAQLKGAGFELLDWFVLPEEDWWTEYYTPLEARLDGFLVRHAGDEQAEAVAAMELREIEVRRGYGNSYGYVFFMARRAG